MVVSFQGVIMASWEGEGAKLFDFVRYRVILLEGRSRAGGRVFTDNTFQGSVDLGGSIITGLEGNPITVLVKQLGLKLHILGTACPLYHCDGMPVDPELDKKVEGLFNSLLDQSARFKIDPNQVPPVYFVILLGSFFFPSHPTRHCPIYFITTDTRTHACMHARHTHYSMVTHTSTHYSMITHTYHILSSTSPRNYCYH
jgi:hypothetical protein